jgi:hypothetical protein
LLELVQVQGRRVKALVVDALSAGVHLKTGDGKVVPVLRLTQWLEGHLVHAVHDLVLEKLLDHRLQKQQPEVLRALGQLVDL